MSLHLDLEDDGEVMSEINMTPLVDVMLVLLIIFIVTIPVMNHAVKLELPKASSQPEEIQPRRIDIAVDGSGRYFWNREALSKESLEQRLAVAAKDGVQPQIHLRADRTTQYEHVASLLSLAGRLGLSRIAFVTDPAK